MTNQRKKNLSRRPQNPLDAHILAMKRRAWKHAKGTVGNDVLAAAETYEQALIHGPNAPGVDIPPSPANSAEEGEVAPQDPEAEDQERQHFKPHYPGINKDGWGQDVSKVIDATEKWKKKNWRSRFPAMFPVFLSCQQMSGNWSHCAHNIDWKDECNCVGLNHTLDVRDLICEVFSLLTSDTS
ncbi:hypothetical protein DFH28DRAFT_882717 [Melampsora americana]|nr:hypothetical protein DFH28DRAFT_882717 [Melampsora americana]